MFVTLACSIRQSELFKQVTAACQDIFGYNSNAWRVVNGTVQVYYKDIMIIERYINQYELGV